MIIPEAGCKVVFVVYLSVVTLRYSIQYTCKEFRALTANVYFRVAYSLNVKQATSFSGRVWDNYFAAPL